ncbi:MAG: hypothetical protein N4A76_06990 [Firmicutes bacterium]|nr:hypothetical protein [Bacillota bacterium]
MSIANLYEDNFRKKSNSKENFYQVLSYLYETGSIISQRDLLYYSTEKMPLTLNSKIVYGSTRPKTIRTTEKIIIQAINQICSLDQQLFTRQDKKMFFNRLKSPIYMELASMIADNPSKILIALYSSLEYCCYASTFMVNWFNCYINKEDVSDNILPQDDLLTAIITSLNGPMINKTNYVKKVYSNLETYFASTKYSLQYGISYINSCYNLELHKTYITDKNEQVKLVNVLPDLIALLRALYIIEDYRLEYLEGLYKNSILKISLKDGIQSQSHDSLVNPFNRHISSATNYVHNDIDLILEKIEPILKEVYGLTYKELGILQNKFESLEYNIPDDGLLIGTRDEWLNMFQKEISLSRSEADTLMDLLIQEKNIDDPLSMKSKTQLQALRAPILELDMYFFSSIGSLKYSIRGLRSDIREGIYREKDWKNFESFYNKVNSNFELIVAHSLIDNFKNGIIKINTNEKDIINKNGQIIQLPGEIDILFYHKNTLFVIECKNIGMKTNTKAKVNKVKDLSVFKNKSFQHKLDKKVTQIANNIKYVLEYMRISNESIDNTRTFGLLVTRSYIQTHSPNENNDMKYDVIELNELCNYIEHKIKN